MLINSEVRTAGVRRITGMDTDFEQSRLGVHLDLTGLPHRQHAVNRISDLL